MVVFDERFDRKIISNKKFSALEGYIDEQLAKVTLAEFLFNNLGITTDLLLGIKLFPFQEIILRSWFDHGYSMNIFSRGGSKTTLAAIFSTLYPIFYSDRKIVISSNSFRSTRRIINTIERYINAKGAELAKQCYYAKRGKLEFQRRADEMLMECNGGQIIALPMNDRIRGTRGDILIVDEMISTPKDLYESVLLPFLAAKTDIKERLELKEQEDILIQLGELTEDERTIIQSDKKIIGLSSASYDFEFLYKLYSEWINKVMNDKSIIGRKYFVARLSYKSLPSELVEEDIVREAESGGENTASFQREFMALFSSSSDGYFNIRKLHEFTVSDGDLPCVQLKGTQDSKYILAIDPSFSSSKSSDLFAMGVYLLNTDNRSMTQVHSYGVAGGELKDHIAYLYYIISHFNIVFLVGDFGGGNFDFINTVNESGYFLDRNIKIREIEGDFDSEDYIGEVRKAKNSYNLSQRKICYKQIFKADWLRKANEHLQSQIDRGKIFFASRICGHSDMLNKALEAELPIGIKDKNDKDMGALDFCTNQDELIEQTKRQLALIEVKTTSQGTMQFDLPQHLRRSSNPDRARRDLYTCLLMGCWGAKCYYDMMFTPDEKPIFGFEPIIIR